MLETPVLFIIFCRREQSEKVFEQIRLAKPRKLYIAADGPRSDKAGEAEKCKYTREIIQKVDWDCEVKTLLRDENLGCKKSMSSAINWFFENEKEGIILEDDCVADQSFFWFCQEMLEKYRDDTRIFHINGSNFQNDIQRRDGSYYFSKHPHVWGWATWKRAWKHFDIEMKTFPEFAKQNRLADIFENKSTQKLYKKHLAKIYTKANNSWFAYWEYCIFSSNGLCITPNLNLVSNIGFNLEDMTHGGKADEKLGNRPIRTLTEIIHPTFVLPDKMADHYVNNVFYYTFQSRILREVKRVLNIL